MKAIVMEVKNKNIIIMKSNGEFVKIRTDKELKVGDEIDSNIFERKPDILSVSKESKTIIMRITSIAAAVILTFGLGYGAYSYNVPYSYISIDINPSIEITVNRFDRIIALEGVNDDGKRIANLSSYKHVRVDEGIQNIIHSAVQEGYINEEKDNTVFMTLSSKDENKIDLLDKALETTAEQEIQSSGVEAELYIENVPVQNHIEAEKLGISPGKLVLIEKLKEKEPEIEIQNYADVPVKEIMRSIAGNAEDEVFKNRMKEEEAADKASDKAAEKAAKKAAKDKKRENKENKGNREDDEGNEIKGNKENSINKEDKNNKNDKDNKKDKADKDNKENKNNKADKEKEADRDNKTNNDKPGKEINNKNSKSNNSNNNLNNNLKNNLNNNDKKTDKSNKDDKTNEDNKSEKSSKSNNENRNKDNAKTKDDTSNSIENSKNKDNNKNIGNKDNNTNNKNNINKDKNKDKTKVK